MNNKKETNKNDVESIESIENIKSKRNSEILRFLFYVFLIIGIVFIIGIINNAIKSVDTLDVNTLDVINDNPNNLSFEQINCLTEQYKFYGTDWCVHCKNQKKELGNIIVQNTFINCDENKALCENIGVEGYPMNVMINKNNGDLARIYGELSIQKIINYTGCSIN